jgi:uncharacterized membrane protein YidH (DUF202 family)
VTDHEATGPEPTGPGATGPGASETDDGDAGLALERTSLSWTRTAISFAALGGVMLKDNVITGLLILAVVPLIWRLGRLPRSGSPPSGLPTVGATRVRVITASVVGVALLSLVIAVLGPSVPGALHR